MTLNDIWFILFVVIVAAYLILDGFDMGAGMLHLFVAKTDDERRTVLNTIGPVWDGNEGWIVLGAGALFAAFPLAYASIFSGFYGAMMVLLLVMIMRTASIESRSRRPGGMWRRLWDVMFALTSFGIAFLLGVAFGNIISGVPLYAGGDIRISYLGLLSPYALLIGLTTAIMLSMHGAMYLMIKTEGDLERRVGRAVPVLLSVFTALIIVVIIATLLFQRHIAQRYIQDPWLLIVPAADALALLWAWRMARAGRFVPAFISTGLVVGLTSITAGIGVFPNLLVSSVDPQYNLTVYNAAAADNTLLVMLIMALIGMPLAVIYTSSIYYILRGKVKMDSHSY